VVEILSDVRLQAPVVLLLLLVNCGAGCRPRGLDLAGGISGGSGRGMRYGEMTLLRSSE